MYQQYFHFSESPFSIAPDPHFMFMSERHQEGLAHLLYGINMGGGFVALTGEVGTGKTSLCHCLLQQLPANIDIALILNPKLNAIELLATICDELGIVHNAIPQTAKNLIDAINRHLLTAYANGRRTVLLIDEAQNLSLEVLEQIRLLTNLETSKTKLLQIILVGQPELKDLLYRQDLRQLNQRITARYHLLPLSFDETRAYIHHRLTVCNGNPGLFKERAIRKIYQVSSGIPRIINILCDRALLGAYATNASSISADIITRAAQETLGLNNTRPWTSAAIVSILFGCVAAGIYFFNQNTSAITQASRILPTPTSLLTHPTRIEIQQPQSKSDAMLITKSSEAEGKSFAVWLENPALSMQAATVEALKVWKKPVPSDDQIDCINLLSVGLYCLSNKASWKDLLALDRPAILEFSVGAEEKRYALLVGVDKGQAVFRFKEDLKFPLADVLNAWGGQFLLFWQSPRPYMQVIIPQKLSSNVPWLRAQLSARDAPTSIAEPLFFDDEVKAQVIEFQRQHHLLEDGIVGAQTLIHLDNQTGANHSPHLKITD